jgi:uncharacterized protein with HEPN domain
MRGDAALLLDMLIATRKIRQFTTDVTQAQFETEAIIQSAITRELQVIGEAARLISADTKTKHSVIQ